MAERSKSTLFLTGATGALAAAVRDLYLVRGWSVAGFSKGSDPYEDSNYASFDCDATNGESMQTAFNRAEEAVGRPRALIATVGGVRPWKPIEETSASDFQFLMDLNLFSAFNAIKAAIPMMKAAGIGSIITIGAIPGLSPEAKKSGYSAAKAGLIALTKAAGIEGKEYGMNANVIVPTVIRTKANEEWGTTEEIPKWTEPESIAETCYFLTSDNGREINGSVITIPNKM